MIASFADQGTEAFYLGTRLRGIPTEIVGRARRLLDRLHVAKNLQDLRTPPGARLEKLKGNRRGQYSIRVSDQWRICFMWENGDAYGVELTNHYR